MAKRLQHRGGTTSQHSTFTGAVREVTVDTDKNTLVVHDGATAGGHPLATATNFTSTGIDDNATSTAITIDSSERVGIGIGSPETNLHIYQSTAPAKIRLQRGGSNILDGELGEIEFYNSDGSNDTPAVTAKITASAELSNGSGGNLRFFTHDGTEGGEGSSPVERVRLDGFGNFGIGTSNPSQLLHIEKTTGEANILLSALDNSSNCKIEFGDSDDANAGRLVYTHSSNAMRFYTNGSEAMRIDSSGNLGIGTSSPISTLDVNGQLNIISTQWLTFGNKNILFSSGAVGGTLIQSPSSAENIIFRNSSGSERMRIDSSGNLLMAKTSNNTNTAGFEIIPAGRIGVTRSNNITAILNRLSSDGEIVRIQKDGTTNGQIGVRGNTLHIGSDDVGLEFHRNDDKIYPHNTSSNTSRDNSISLGGSSVRFKDLYLGGGLYVGGTGSANHLDDYEEGEAFVGITDASGNAYSFYEQNGQYNKLVYTKIGRLVFFTIRFYTSSTSGTNGGEQARITGLPFTAISSRAAGGAFIQISFNSMNTTNALVMGGQIVSGQTYILLQKQDTDGDYSSLTISELGAARIDVTGMYHAI